MVIPPIAFRFGPDTDVLEALAEALVESPKLFAIRIERELMPDFRQIALELLRSEPGPPRYPIQWTSEKQRRFVMAMLRRAGKIPYVRTHELAQSWQVEFLRDGDLPGEVVIDNQANAAIFVYGEHQQLFHANTGWFQSDDVITMLWEHFQDQLIHVWDSIMEIEQ